MNKIKRFWMQILFIIVWTAGAFLFFGCSFEIKSELDSTQTIQQESEKLVYDCIDCGERFCSQAENILSIPSFDPDTLQSDSGVVCPFCGSHMVTIIGEIDVDGHLIEYDY